MSGGEAKASVFSGRPDPVWNVDDDLVRRLEAIWRTLDEYRGTPPVPPPLGYRGCTLVAGDVEWAAFGGVVSRHGRSGRDARWDATRRLERTLLESAPDGSFPAVVLQSLDDAG